MRAALTPSLHGPRLCPSQFLPPTPRTRVPNQPPRPPTPSQPAPSDTSQPSPTSLASLRFAPLPFRCETLQDDCPHESLEYVKGVIAQSLGRPAEELFQWIEERPLGSASIGQAGWGSAGALRLVASFLSQPFRPASQRAVRTQSPLAHPRAPARTHAHPHPHPPAAQVHKAQLMDGRLVAVKARTALFPLFPLQNPLP